MNTVHKQTLMIETKQELLVPVNTEFLSVAVQNGDICIWYKCNPSVKKVTRKIYIHGTGHEISNIDAKFIGTILLADATLVFHIFAED